MLPVCGGSISLSEILFYSEELQAFFPTPDKNKTGKLYKKVKVDNKMLPLVVVLYLLLIDFVINE